MNSVIRILFSLAMTLAALRPAARALQWTGIEAVLRPQADGTVSAAVYETSKTGQVLTFNVEREFEGWPALFRLA